MPSVAALAATSDLCISSTSVSHDGQAIRLTVSMASSHAGQPALKISILRFLFMDFATSQQLSFDSNDMLNPVVEYRVKRSPASLT